jgi:hypothetical protein
MYYRIRSEIRSYDESLGHDSQEVSYSDGQFYQTSHEASEDTLRAYRRYLWDEEITDYRPGPLESFKSSGRFGNKYEQTFLPVRHFKRSLTVDKGSPIKRVRLLGFRTDIFRHQADMTDEHTYWGAPYVEVGAYLPYNVKGSSGGSTVSWNSVEAEAVKALPKLLNDNKLLNLEQVGLATFLAELKDVRNLTNIAKFHRDQGDISDKFLGVNFGVLPLVSDIKSMYELIQNMDPSIDKWNQMSDSGTARAYHVTLEDNVVSGSHTKFGGSQGGIINHSYTYEYEYEQTSTIKAHAYVIPGRCDDRTDLALKASLWGLDKPLTAVWNAIPFSFAVDWVANVGDIISNFEFREPHLDFTLVGFGASHKVVTTITTKAYLNLWGEKIPIGVSTFEDSQYFRVPLPIEDVYAYMENYPTGPLETSMSLSNFQIGITAALAHQRWYKR